MLWFKKNELLESVQENEGFEEKPYIDPLVVNAPDQHGIPPDEFAIIEKHLDLLKLTFGMGLTYITKEEALKVTEMRLEAIRKQIVINYPHVKNKTVIDVLTEMAYQMGLRGLFGFINMHKAIKAKDYLQASKEMLDSRWYGQTPERAKRLSQKLATA